MKMACSSASVVLYLALAYYNDFRVSFLAFLGMMMAVNIFEMSPRSGSSAMGVIVAGFQKNPLASLSLSVVIVGSSINMDPRFAIYLLTMSAVTMRDRKIPEIFMTMVATSTTGTSTASSSGSPSPAPSPPPPPPPTFEYSNYSYVAIFLYCLLAAVSLETFLTSCGAIWGAPRRLWTRPSS